MMNSPMFTRVTCDFYTRHYQINPNMVDGLSVTVYAECYPNTERVNNHYYSLNILFSVDDYPDREFLIGVTFGTEQMDKKLLDQEIDTWIEQTVTDDRSFPAYIQDYLRKEEMWEDASAELSDDGLESDGIDDTADPD